MAVTVPRRSWCVALAACPNSQFLALFVLDVLCSLPLLGDLCLEEEDDLTLIWCWKSSSQGVCLLHIAPSFALPAPDVWSLNHLNWGQTKQRGPSFLCPFGSTSCKQLGAIYSNCLRWDWQKATKPRLTAALGTGCPPQPKPFGFLLRRRQCCIWVVSFVPLCCFFFSQCITIKGRVLD